MIMYVDKLSVEYPVFFDAETEDFFRLEPEANVERTDSAAYRVAGVSSVHVIQDQSGFWLESTEPGVTLNHRPVKLRQKLSHRSIIQTGEASAHVFLEHDDLAFTGKRDIQEWLVVMLRRGPDEVPTADVDHDSGQQNKFPKLAGSIRLKAGTTTVGRDGEHCDLTLPSVQVSRQHARIDSSGRQPLITDLKSFNGTFVNGQRVRKSATLLNGDRIDIGPYGLIFTGDSLFPLATGEHVNLAAENLTYQVPDGTASKILLNNVSLVISPQQFVSIVGPTGSGKSVLLKALTGYQPATCGNVFLNRESLYANFEALKRHVAVVPQRDVLHEQLRLQDALYYTACLRLPEDMSQRDRHTCVDLILETVGLTAHAQTRIAKLSGGQTRRASLANEILARPALICLDEVTSGLDEKTDAEMMRLFRELANQGKTIVCVTHTLNHVPENCDLVVILAPGGNLAFFGAPAEALAYFEVERLADVYGLLEQRASTEWRQQYVESAYCEQHVVAKQSATFPAAEAPARSIRPRSSVLVKSFLSQLVLLTRRNFAVKKATPKWFGLMALQCAGLAILLAWLFGDTSKLSLSEAEQKQLVDAPSALAATGEFPGLGLLNTLPPGSRDAGTKKATALWLEQKRGTMNLRLLVALGMCALWLGCNNASGEIVRERALFDKEQEVNLQASSYLGSKVILLSIVTSMQVTLLLGVIKWCCNLPGPFVLQLAILIATSIAGVLLGLAISAWSRTPEFSTILVPIVLIPQIMLAGTFVPLSGLALICAECLISLHWGYRGLVSQLQFDPNVEQLLKMTGALEDFPASDGYVAYVVLFLHALALLAVAYLGLRYTLEQFSISTIRKYLHV